MSQPSPPEGGQLDQRQCPTPHLADHAALIARADRAALRAHGRLLPDTWASLWRARLDATRERLAAILETRAAA